MTNLIIYMIIQTIVAIFAIMVAIKRRAMSSSTFDRYKEDSTTLRFKFADNAYVMYAGNFLYAAYGPYTKSIYVYIPGKEYKKGN